VVEGVNFSGLFSRFRLRKGRNRAGATPFEGEEDFFMKGEQRMIGKTILGLIAAAMAFFVLAAPTAAAERTFQFDIPGCAT
jgi:hypothetical protein